MDFVTQEEKQRIERKLAELRAKRPIITKRIGEAADEGDLSENAEYHAAREDQGLNEAEIRRIEQRLKEIRVADAEAIPDGMVFVGSVVRLRDTDDDSDDLYKLVGEASGNFDADEIEVTTGSPMGEVLMKAHVGDVVKVDLPRGAKRYEIVEIV